jgi:thymidylate synthase
VRFDLPEISNFRYAPEQLKRVHGEVDKIENNLNVADRTIRGMESVWGSIRNMWSKGTSTAKPPSAAEAQRLDRAVDQRQSAKIMQRGSDVAPVRAEAKAVREYGDDWREKQRKLEDQQDEDLDHISQAVRQLKTMSMDMGYTLDAQTKSIERLSDRTDAVDARLAKSNVRVKRML